MTIELTATNASEIAAALLEERRRAGSPAMGLVLTFVVVTDERDHYDSLKVARTVSREHPSRILLVIRRSARTTANLDAELSIGGSGESVLLRTSGELAKHAESAVLPLLLPDSPVVVWWPGRPPDDPAGTALGQLAQRRITDSAAPARSRPEAMLTQARNYAPGNTDLAWTRLTPWRALLAAALDQYTARVHSAEVEGERGNPSADLLAAWLANRLHVPVGQKTSRGPGLTSVVMQTGGGPVQVYRPDGKLAQLRTPNAPDRPVALHRRDLAELLAEELRRLDPDEAYAEAVRHLARMADGGQEAEPAGQASTSSDSRRSSRSSRAGGRKPAARGSGTGSKRPPRKRT
ncbi:MAG TPA: glucose-6-phosphate dehydrogenase assembly protein OpcA [Nocardioidaceae bacterium]|nr:glucose-6-phosphate dehydrogenase assembly protein OpcA [Nocardioidaceae bacterium]